MYHVVMLESKIPLKCDMGRLITFNNMLLSLLPPSLMVAPERQLANTYLDSPSTSVNNLNHTSMEHQDPHGHTMS